jgi:hypothetical protein
VHNYRSCYWYIIAKNHLHWFKFTKYASFQYSQFSIHKKAGKKLTPMIFPQIQQGEPQQRTRRKECGTVITGSSSNLLMCIKNYWTLDNYNHGCFRKWLVNLPSKARRTIQTSMRYQSYKTSSSKCYRITHKKTDGLRYTKQCNDISKKLPHGIIQRAIP